MDNVDLDCGSKFLIFLLKIGMVGIESLISWILSNGLGREGAID